MAAISMPKISSILRKIIADFPELTFKTGENFHWSPKSKTIYYPSISNIDDLYQLLHEVGHAKLGHNSYHRDVALIELERDAWSCAANQLASRYGLSLSADDDIVQESLDTYRQWLHARSSCPKCSAIGIEKSPQAYNCLSCGQEWTVNEARTCRLMRYKK